MFFYNPDVLTTAVTGGPLNVIVILIGNSCFDWFIPSSYYTAFFFRGTHYYLLSSDVDVEKWRNALHIVVHPNSWGHTNRLINKHGCGVGIAIHEDFCPQLRVNRHFSLDADSQRTFAGKARRILVDTDTAKSKRLMKWQQRQYL